MNSSQIVFLINDDVRAIRCAYEPSGKEYVFKTMLQDVKKDDLLMVQTDTRWGYTVVKVLEVDVEPDLESNIEYKWAFSRVAVEELKEFTSQEDEAVRQVQAAERRRKKAELRKTMFGGEEDMINQLKLASPPAE